jgi:hypothetical protein
MTHNSWPVSNRGRSKWQACEGNGGDRLYCARMNYGSPRYKPVSLRSCVRHKRSADPFVDASFPMDEVDPTRHLYPQVVLRMQEDMEIRKGGRVERSRSTMPRPRVQSQHFTGVGREDVLRTASPGTIRLVPIARRERRLHRGIVLRWRSARDARRKGAAETRSQ